MVEGRNLLRNFGLCLKINPGVRWMEPQSDFQNLFKSHRLKNLLKMLDGFWRGHSHSFKDIVLIHSVTLPFSSTLVKKTQIEASQNMFLKIWDVE